MNFEDCLKLHKLGKLKEAENGYRDLINQKILNPLVYTSLGLICVKTKRETGAIKLFNQAINIKEEDITAINNLGLIY
jgi:Flp pilus assembly protein TadD, contains TPR repeats